MIRICAAIPMIVISADATAAQIDRLKSAVASEYVTKPLDIQELLEAVEGTLLAAPHAVM